jgi:hypothetical protein
VVLLLSAVSMNSCQRLLCAVFLLQQCKHCVVTARHVPLEVLSSALHTTASQDFDGSAAALTHAADFTAAHVKLLQVAAPHLLCSTFETGQLVRDAARLQLGAGAVQTAHHDRYTGASCFIVHGTSAQLAYLANGSSSSGSSSSSNKVQISVQILPANLKLAPSLISFADDTHHAALHSDASVMQQQQQQQQPPRHRALRRQLQHRSLRLNVHPAGIADAPQHGVVGLEITLAPGLALRSNGDAAAAVLAEWAQEWNSLRNEQQIRQLSWQSCAEGFAGRTDRGARHAAEVVSLVDTLVALVSHSQCVQCIMDMYPSHAT